MKKLYIFLIFNLILLKLVAQNADIESIDSALNKSFEAKLTSTVINPGSKFHEKCYSKEWYLCLILLYNNEIVKNQFLKYNGYEDYFICIDPVKLKQTKIESEFIKEVSMKSTHKNDSVYFRRMKIKQLLSNDSIYVFLNVLVDGKISLFVYRHIIYSNNSNTYVEDFQYILKKQDGLMTRFSPNRIGLLSQFPEKKKEIKKIIRKNWLMVKDEADLAKAIRFLNMEI